MNLYKLNVFIVALLIYQAGQSANLGFEAKTKHCDFKVYLKNFLKRQKSHSKVLERNTFSVSIAQDRRPDGEYWVLWHEQRQLLLFTWPLKSEVTCAKGVPPRSQLDLIKDVVKTKEDIAGSTYLVDEEWAASVVFDAIVRGPVFSIR